MQGLRRTRLYETWVGIRQRCNNPKATGYDRYGGRGIKVCQEWDDFEVFKLWAMSNGYTDSLTIERNNGDGDYEPNNCRWATYSDQNANKPKHKGKHQYIGVRPYYNRWRAAIDVNQKQIHIGLFETEVEAAKARDEYIKTHHLPHKLNF